MTELNLNHIDAEQAMKQLAFMCRDGGVREFRILTKHDLYGTSSTSVFFKSTPEGIEKGLQKASDIMSFKLKDGKSNSNLYVLLNTAPNDFYHKGTVTQKGESTGNDDVEFRHNLFIDCDPERPNSGIMATREEVEACKCISDQVLKFLSEKGFPQGMEVFSGNGTATVIKTNIKKDDETEKLIGDFYGLMQKKFGKAFDVSVKNVARVVRVAGTVNMKGEGEEPRPHRKCYVMDVPEEIKELSLEKLQEIVSELKEEFPESKPEPQKITSSPLSVSSPLGEGDWDQEKAFTFVKNLLDGSGTNYNETIKSGDIFFDLETCPVAGTIANGREISIWIESDGKICYKNMHNSGDGIGWKQVRSALELYKPSKPDYSPPIDSKKLHDTLIKTKTKDLIEKIVQPPKSTEEIEVWNQETCPCPPKFIELLYNYFLSKVEEPEELTHVEKANIFIFALVYASQLFQGKIYYEYNEDKYFASMVAFILLRSGAGKSMIAKAAKKLSTTLNQKAAQNSFMNAHQNEYDVDLNNVYKSVEKFIQDFGHLITPEEMKKLKKDDFYQGLTEKEITDRVRMKNKQAKIGTTKIRLIYEECKTQLDALTNNAPGSSSVEKYESLYPFLCNLCDNAPYQERTITRGTSILEDYTYSAIYCGTPSHIQTMLDSPGFVEKGLAGRCLCPTKRLKINIKEYEVKRVDVINEFNNINSYLKSFSGVRVAIDNKRTIEYTKAVQEEIKDSKLDEESKQGNLTISAKIPQIVNRNLTICEFLYNYDKVQLDHNNEDPNQGFITETPEARDFAERLRDAMFFITEPNSVELENEYRILHYLNRFPDMTSRQLQQASVIPSKNIKATTANKKPSHYYHEALTRLAEEGMVDIVHEKLSNGRVKKYYSSLIPQEEVERHLKVIKSKKKLQQEKENNKETE